MLEYAFKKNQEDNLVHISEVERGLACNCVCPSCKNNLIANKGKRRAHHFSHYKAANCAYGLQTALHIKAKEIIEKYKIFKIPSLEAKYNDISCLITKERLVKFDEVKLEKRQGQIIPDVIGISKGHKIFIEIFVTHKVDVEKKEYVRNKMNVSCIEIDLSNLYRNDKNIEQKALEEEIIFNVENKKWIHNFYYKKILKKIEEKWLKREGKKQAKEGMGQEALYQQAKIKKNKREKVNKNVQKQKFKSADKAQHLYSPSYHVEINRIIEGEGFPSKHGDSYKGYKIAGKVVSNKEILFEARCSVRPDGENFFISFVANKDNKNNDFYREVKTTKEEFESVILSEFRRTLN